MNSYEGLNEKNKIYPYNYMSTVVGTSFFYPKDVRLFNSKLGLVADVNRTINWLLPIHVQGLRNHVLVYVTYTKYNFFMLTLKN